MILLVVEPIPFSQEMPHHPVQGDTIIATEGACHVTGFLLRCVH